jgi:hypothetical protein
MHSQLRSPRGLSQAVAWDYAPKKLEAIILVLMMAPKLSGDAVLGGHHL